VVAAPAARDRAGVTADHDEDSTPPGAPAGAGGLRTAIAAVLTLVLLVAVAAGAWGFLRLDTAEEELAARADVVRVAEQFTVAVNNYDAASGDDYQATVGELLSTKFRAEFENAMEDIVAQVQQAQMESEGEVLASGVATVADDSARVLVVADAAVTTVYDERQRHFRWEVSLVKVDGDWLVDDFTPVA
jgi:Mce-associated membrane protein